MLRPGVSNKLLAICVAVVVYTCVITYKVVTTGLSCKNQCKLCKENSSDVKGQLSDQNIQTSLNILPWEQDLQFDGFNNESGTTDGHYIVPNFVHFIKFNQKEFSFVHAVCVLAAFKHQKPEKLFIHTDLDGFKGYYWDVIMNTTGFKDVLVINKIKVPVDIFGQVLQKKWKYYHGGDVARLLVMKKYGGIYLDNDSYVVRSLNDFRRYEMTIGWVPGKDMGNQIVVAHKNARFLQNWYDSYKNNYKSNSWYYNAGTYPTHHILDYQPQLVHRVEKLFGNYDVKWKIYMTDFPEWKDYYSFHLLSNRLNRGLKDPTHKLKYPVVFDHVNVLKYPVAFREMCKAVYPFEKI